LKVTNDADAWPSGAGEIKFSFGAGDVETKEPLGETFHFQRDISDEDPPIGFKEKNEIIGVPSRLWVQANAFESDSSIFYGGIQTVGMQPHFNAEGTVGSDYGWGVFAGVTRVFDTSSPGVTNFEMSADHFGLAFTVSGRIGVFVDNGRLLTMRGARLQPKQSFAGFQKNGSFTVLTVGKTTKSHRLVGLGADGAIYHKALIAEVSSGRGEDWKRVSRPGEGPVTAIVSGPDRLSLLALGQDGAVLHQSSIDDRPDGEWRSLGGRFTDPVVAAVENDGTVELFGVDQAGVLFHRAFSEQEGKHDIWKRIGDGVNGRLLALPILGIGLAIFVLHRDSRVLHALRRDGRWQEGNVNWQQLGKAPGAWLTARVDEGYGLTIAVTAEDLTLRVLRWPNYPDGTPPECWEELGSIQRLLQERLTTAARAGEGKALPAHA
jgi:hypothetical protein